MKKMMIVTAAIAALIATPSLAQTSRTSRTAVPPMTSDPTLGPGPYAAPPAGYGLIYGPGAEAYAAAPGAAGQAVQPGIYGCGQYLGWDPDPNIRLQLLRDACVHQGD